MTVAAALLVTTAGARAQSLSSGTIVGSVTNELGAPLAEVFVDLSSAHGVSRRHETDRDGTFQFLALPHGTYVVFAEALGYLPVRVTGVTVVAGQSAEIRIRLTQATPPVHAIDTTAFPGGGAETGRAGVGQWFGDLEFNRLPDAGRALEDLLRYATFATVDRSVQGLRPTLNGGLVDGIPLSGTHHPWLPYDPAAGSGLPLLEFDRAELLTNASDVERGEFAGGQLSGMAVRGTRRLGGRVFGDWSGDALTSSSHFQPGGFSNLRGGAVLTGPILTDTAHFVIGVEAERVRTPLGSPWVAGALDAPIQAASLDSFTVDLASSFAPRTTAMERVSGFGRLAWQLAERHAMDVWANVGAGTLDRPVLGGGAAPNLATRVKRLDVNGGGTLTSVLGASVMTELRVGFERGQRKYGLGAVAATAFADPGIRLGTEPGLPAELNRTAIRGSGSFQYVTGVHRVKLGVIFGLHTYDQTFAYGSSGAFYFSDPDAFARGEGVFVRAVGIEPVAKFSTRQLGAFLQDTWTVVPGFDFQFGLRYEHAFLPDGITPNAAWERRTGLRNDVLDTRRDKLSPRAGFVWRLGAARNWEVRGQSGIYYDRVDPALLGELRTHAGAVEIQRGVGPLGTWPAAPDLVAAPTQGPQLALLGPEFEAPRTGRVSLGISRFFGPGAAFHVSTSYRHTDFLPRREDLNRLPAAAGTDQHGRRLYGTLVQQDALLAAVPGSNRRFPQFDVVSAIHADGFSDYWDVTVGVERRGRRFDLMARYTYSQTTDNWLGGGARTLDEAFSPFPDDEVDWADGRSDFDVPHRFVAGLVLSILRDHVTLGGFYHSRSGTPFTPGYRTGVDANGDGFVGNDPAFVDQNVPGISDLFGTWECLRARQGRFVERNGCRGEPVSSLDLRLTIGAAVAGLPVEVVADFLNVLDAGFPVPDRALYLVDRNGALAEDPATGVVTVPLVANPSFGQAAQRLGTGRAVRVGMRINY